MKLLYFLLLWLLLAVGIGMLISRQLCKSNNYLDE